MAEMIFPLIRLIFKKFLRRIQSSKDYDRKLSAYTCFFVVLYFLAKEL